MDEQDHDSFFNNIVLKTLAIKFQLQLIKRDHLKNDTDD